MGCQAGSGTVLRLAPALQITAVHIRLNDIKDKGIDADLHPGKAASPRVAGISSTHPGEAEEQ